MKIENVSIKGKDTSYNIHIGSSFVDKKLIELEKAGCFFVIDEKVYSLYKDILPKKNIYIYRASEKNKTLRYVDKILTFLAENRALRDSTLVAVGGGITGDITGLAASLYMRGIRLIQVPTTLLSMVDSSVGGKTAVNFYSIKNNIGSFYQPSEVLIDIDFLKTLSKKEFLNGFAEVIKTASISGQVFFDYLKQHKKEILQQDRDIMIHIISTSCRLKADIVEKDEKEIGLRKLLNFGHTVAHGIESDSKYRITHGYAVAIGMVKEVEYAFKKGFVDNDIYINIKDILKSFGYNIDYKVKDMDTFYSAVAKDKKAEKNGITLACTGSNMQGILIKNISPKEIIDLFIEN